MTGATSRTIVIFSRIMEERMLMISSKKIGVTVLVEVTLSPQTIAAVKEI